MRDRVDDIVDQWHLVRPDLDATPLRVVARLTGVTHHIERRIGKAFKAQGLSPSEFEVLANLRRLGPPFEASISTLNTGTYSKSTMTYRLDRLADAELVDRRQDSTNRRRALVRLTARGLELVERLIEKDLEHQRRLLSGLSAADRCQLGHLLRLVSTSLADTARRPEDQS